MRPIQILVLFIVSIAFSCKKDCNVCDTCSPDYRDQYVGSYKMNVSKLLVIKMEVKLSLLMEILIIHAQVKDKLYLRQDLYVQKVSNYLGFGKALYLCMHLLSSS